MISSSNRPCTVGHAAGYTNRLKPGKPFLPGGVYGPPDAYAARDPLLVLYCQLISEAIYIDPHGKTAPFLYDILDVGYHLLLTSGQTPDRPDLTKAGLSRDDAIAWGQYCVDRIQRGNNGEKT